MGFKLKNGHRNDILWYRAKDGRVVRMYGHQLTDQFVEKYLTLGSKEQLEERKSFFEELPRLTKEKPAEEPKQSEGLSEKEAKAKTKAQLMDILDEHGIKYSESDLKAELVKKVLAIK